MRYRGGESLLSSREATDRRRSGRNGESGAEHRTPKRLPPRGIADSLTMRDNLFGIRLWGGSGPVDRCHSQERQPIRGPQGRFGVRRSAPLSITCCRGQGEQRGQDGGRPAKQRSECVVFLPNRRREDAFLRVRVSAGAGAGATGTAGDRTVSARSGRTVPSVPCRPSAALCRAPCGPSTQTAVHPQPWSTIRRSDGKYALAGRPRTPLRPMRVRKTDKEGPWKCP